MEALWGLEKSSHLSTLKSNKLGSVLCDLLNDGLFGILIGVSLELLHGVQIKLFKWFDRVVCMAEYRSTSHPFKRKKNGKPASCQEHIRVWFLVNGKIPEGHIIHHINGDKHDNRIENLRCMNRSDHALLHSKSNH